jgi:hypothetical protein
MRCNRLKQLNNYVVGIIPAGDREPDYREFFPDDDPIFNLIDFENLRDEYGNFQYKIVENEGRNFIIHEPQEPKEEQIEKVAKKSLSKKIRDRYSLDDEIMMIRKILLQSDIVIPEDCKLYFDFITKIIKDEE